MVRAVATFIHMYPAYKSRDALDEYAIVFYSMLEEAYRMQNEHYLMLARIVQLPRASAESVKEFMKGLEYGATNLGDILNTSGEGSSKADIKKILSG